MPDGPESGVSLLAGRRGVIVGISSRNGVGYRSAATLRAMGAELGITSRAERREDALRMAEELGCSYAELEATDEGSIERAFSRLGSALGRLDFLVHTLVHVPEGALARSLLELSAAEFAAAMEVGVRSLIAVSRCALPWLERSDAARIVALQSSGGELAIPGYHVVGIAKAGLGAAVRYLAQELGPRGVSCNALSFSILETDAAERFIGRDKTRETRRYLAKRSMTRKPVEFSDVAHGLAFLVSPLCRNVTGETLNVDGGFSRGYF